MIRCQHKGVAESRSSPREVSGQDSIVEDVGPAHLAHRQVAHSHHHIIPVKEPEEEKKGKTKPECLKCSSLLMYQTMSYLRLDSKICHQEIHV